MPELLEVEGYRRLAEGALGRRITGVEAPDAWYLKAGATATVLSAALTGRRLTRARRRGKLLILETSGRGEGPDPAGEGSGPALGMRFGMTGRLFLDGRDEAGPLLYSSRRKDPAWERFALVFSDGGRLVMSDPRRLGGVLLDPEESGLGPDAASLTAGELRAALAGSQSPLKARLLDQTRLAGVGNLLADEMLWRAGLSPLRAAGSLSAAEVRRLHHHLGRTVTELTERGGSHTGDLMSARRPGSVCPRDGTPLARSTVGGRTTWWCPKHQC